MNPKYLKRISELEFFRKEIANLLMDGELKPDGSVFILENDDAVNTLHDLIQQARELGE
jgi:hypothetical protein